MQAVVWNQGWSSCSESPGSIGSCGESICFNTASHTNVAPLENLVLGFLQRHGSAPAVWAAVNLALHPIRSALLDQSCIPRDILPGDMDWLGAAPGRMKSPHDWPFPNGKLYWGNMHLMQARQYTQMLTCMPQRSGICLANPTAVPGFIDPFPSMALSQVPGAFHPNLLMGLARCDTWPQDWFSNFPSFAFENFRSFAQGCYFAWLGLLIEASCVFATPLSTCSFLNRSQVLHLSLLQRLGTERRQIFQNPSAQPAITRDLPLLVVELHY